MKNCGWNNYFQFGENSNNNSSNGTACICPPQNSGLDIFSFLSYSCYSVHAVMITNESKALALGYNEDCRILKSLPQQLFKVTKEIIFQDQSNHPIKFLSAVCGFPYTLYLISGKNEKKNQLAYTYRNQLEPNPLFLNIGDHNALKLFGGYQTSSVINSDGSIFIITESIFKNPTTKIQASFLPEGEKAVKVACCNKYVIVLGSSGRIFESTSDITVANKIEFKLITEIKADLTFVDIAGTYEHFLAVCSNGRVFGRGQNTYGQLGFSKDKKNIDQLTEISSLNKYKIVSAAAGYSHSFFITSEGKVIACGQNDYGQLLLNHISKDCVFTPIETTIKSGATFAIAGIYESTVFVGVQPPPNTPNMIIKDFAPTSKSDPKKSDAESSNMIEQLRQRIIDLENENAKLRQSQSMKKFDILDAETIHGLRTIREINFGGSGKVLEVAKEERYALKMMNAGDTNFQNQRNFLGEYEKLAYLNHPNIVRAYGIFLSDEKTPLSILLELCIQDINKAIKSSSMSKIDIAKAIYQIAEAMKYVHSKGLIHRDLKPSNILIGSDGLIRISDFGISKLMSSEEQMSTLGVGTQKFMAPEILLEKKYDEKVDVYSFGVLAFFMISGGEMPRINIIDVGNGKKAKIPSDFTPLATSIISNCWNFDPKTRPSFKQILEDLESNSYKVFDLNDSEVKLVQEFVKEHKKKIPLI